MVQLQLQRLLLAVHQQMADQLRGVHYSLVVAVVPVAALETPVVEVAVLEALMETVW